MREHTRAIFPRFCLHMQFLTQASDFQMFYTQRCMFYIQHNTQASANTSCQRNLPASYAVLRMTLTNVRELAWQCLNDVRPQWPDLAGCIPPLASASFCSQCLWPERLMTGQAGKLQQALCLLNKLVWEGPGCPWGSHVTRSFLIYPFEKRAHKGVGEWIWLCVAVGKEYNYSSTETPHLPFFFSLPCFIPTLFFLNGNTWEISIAVGDNCLYNYPETSS